MNNYSAYKYKATGQSMETLSWLNNFSKFVVAGIIIAIIVAVLVQLLFLKKGKEEKYTGLTLYLYNLFTFKKIIIVDIIKFLYICTAVFITVVSFSFIKFNFMAFLSLIIFGNVAVRVIYEIILIQAGVWANTNDIIKLMKEKDNN